VEAVNGNIKSLLRRGRGYKNLRYLLLKAQRMAALKTEFRRHAEGRLKWPSTRILAQSHNSHTSTSRLGLWRVERPYATNRGLITAYFFDAPGGTSCLVNLRVITFFSPDPSFRYDVNV